MPAPFVIVTLTDKDGDEFPIRLQGKYNLDNDLMAADLYSNAVQSLQSFEAEGEMQPVWPVRRASITQH